MCFFLLFTVLYNKSLSTKGSQDYGIPHFAKPYINAFGKKLFKIEDDSESEIFDLLKKIKIVENNNDQIFPSYLNFNETTPILNENKNNYNLFYLIEKEFQNTNNDGMGLGEKENSETVIKKLFSITIEWKENKLSFDLIASKFLWNGNVKILNIIA